MTASPRPEARSQGPPPSPQADSSGLRVATSLCCARGLALLVSGGPEPWRADAISGARETDFCFTALPHILPDPVLIDKTMRGMAGSALTSQENCLKF